LPSRRAGDVTGLLLAWQAGEPGALDRLIPLVYAELRHLAHAHMLGERPGHALQTTALVHEAFLRLVDVRAVRARSRTQFFALCAQVMRRILVDAARARNARKRGGEVLHVALPEGLLVAEDANGPDLVALDDALDALATFDARMAKVVELRYFGGLTLQETADTLGVSPDTVTRDWKLARMWLLGELRRERGPTETVR
jgi:RNA polymerase sigma-70 factor (ECF subfamily)